MQCKVHDSVHGSEVNESTAMLCQLPALNLHDAHCVLHTRISDSRISGLSQVFNRSSVLI